LAPPVIRLETHRTLGVVLELTAPEWDCDSLVSSRTPLNVRQPGRQFCAQYGGELLKDSRPLFFLFSSFSSPFLPHFV